MGAAASPDSPSSPGSPDYRKTVGKMIYSYSRCLSQQQRMKDFVAHPEVAAPPRIGVLPSKNSPDEEDLSDEIPRIEDELDNARASYGRACAWAWPYINLRPTCHAPASQPATILDAYQPQPTIRLSEASPDYKYIVASLVCWEPKIGNAHARLKDLLDDRTAASAAMASLHGRLLDEKVPPTDSRLAQMFETYRQLKPALRPMAE